MTKCFVIMSKQRPERSTNDQRTINKEVCILLYFTHTYTNIRICIYVYHYYLQRTKVLLDYINQNLSWSFIECWIYPHIDSFIFRFVSNVFHYLQDDQYLWCFYFWKVLKLNNYKRIPKHKQILRIIFNRKLLFIKKNFKSILDL